MNLVFSVQNFRFWEKLSHKKVIKMVWWVIFHFMPTFIPWWNFFLKKISIWRKNFPQTVTFFKKLSHKNAIKKTGGSFSNTMWHKSGDFFRKCGDFEKNKKWGFVGIFASGGGDFQSESSGSTGNTNNNNNQLINGFSMDQLGKEL